MLIIQVAIVQLCCGQIILGSNKTLKIEDLSDLLATDVTFF